MTPQELFDADPAPFHWVHGRWMGVDQGNGLWIRKDAELKAKMPFFGALSHIIITSDRKVSLNPQDRPGPAWKYFRHLRIGSIGPGWIAVD